MSPADCWKGAIYAGMRAKCFRLSRATVFRKLFSNGDCTLERSSIAESCQRRQRSTQILKRHAMGEQFKKPENDHLQEYAKMHSWTEILICDPRARGHKILDCHWVYV